MANPSSSYPILCACFNQDNSCFAVGTSIGFKIFIADTGRLCSEQDIGAFSIVEMLYSSNLLVLVGAGEQTDLSPRRLSFCNTTRRDIIKYLNYVTSVLAVRLNTERLIVLLEDKTFIYDINSLLILSTLDTVPNPKGLCAFSCRLNACFLALPASTRKGSVLVYNVRELQSRCEIEAHRSPLATMALSSNGLYLATASEQGTIVRVYNVSDGTECFSFRRGTYPSTIYSLSFGSSLEFPDVLAATSSSGSLHVFMLGVSQRSSSSLIGSIIPVSISNILDTAHHHVRQNVVAEGVKSHVVIRKAKKTVDGSFTSFMATILILSYDGYFREYLLRINHKNEATWSLDKEQNLLTAIFQ